MWLNIVNTSQNSVKQGYNKLPNMYKGGEIKQKAYLWLYVK